jgi:hypothetical protein
MKIRVTFLGGKVQDFVVDEDILIMDFIELVVKAGGQARRMEFL